MVRQVGQVGTLGPLAVYLTQQIDVRNPLTKKASIDLRMSIRTLPHVP